MNRVGAMFPGVSGVTGLFPAGMLSVGLGSDIGRVGCEMKGCREERWGWGRKVFGFGFGVGVGVGLRVAVALELELGLFAESLSGSDGREYSVQLIVHLSTVTTVVVCCRTWGAICC
jgi:hypothetical protein